MNRVAVACIANPILSHRFGGGWGDGEEEKVQRGVECNNDKSASRREKLLSSATKPKANWKLKLIIYGNFVYEAIERYKVNLLQDVKESLMQLKEIGWELLRLLRA